MKIDILIDKKHLASIVIIIILLIISCISMKKDENFSTPSTTKSNSVKTITSATNSVELGLPGMVPWGTCNMTLLPNKQWANNTKWIGGSISWIDKIEPGTYYFTKTIIVIDPTKIKNAIFYIISDDGCNVYLNDIKINNMLISQGWGEGRVANLLIVDTKSFAKGINEFMFENFNNGYLPKKSGLLANLIITYKDKNATDIYKTDNSWLYHDTVRPKAINAKKNTSDDAVSIDYLSNIMDQSNNIINSTRMDTLDNQDRINNLETRIHKIKKDLAITNKSNNSNKITFY